MTVLSVFCSLFYHNMMNTIKLYKGILHKINNVTCTVKLTRNCRGLDTSRLVYTQTYQHSNYNDALVLYQSVQIRADIKLCKRWPHRESRFS